MDRRKINIYLFYAIALFQGMVFYAPIATLYRQVHGVTLFQITLIESISLIVTIALEIPWGYITDRIGYKKTLVICNILFFISKIIFWQATSFGWFLAERLLLSIVLSGLSGCDTAYLYSVAGEKDSHRAFGFYTALSTAGILIASVLFSAVLSDQYALTSLLTVFSYGVSMALTFFISDAPSAPKTNAAFSVRVRKIGTALRSDKRFLLFLLAATLLAESNQTITVFFAQVQYVALGIPQDILGYVYIFLTVAGLSAALSARLIKRLGERTGGGILFFAGALACAALALTDRPILAVLSVLALRASASLFAPLEMNIQNRQVSIADRVTMLSIYASVMRIGAVFTNLIFGRFAQLNLRLALGAGALFCLLGLLLYLLWASKSTAKAE